MPVLKKERTGGLLVEVKEIHWADIDEDISVEGLLAGKPSGESQESFKKWLQNRPSRPTG